MDVQVVPVVFDRDRLVAPLQRNGLPVDKVILLHAATADATTPWNQLASRLLANVRRDLVMSGIKESAIESVELEELRDYEYVYKQAHEIISTHVARGDTIHVNVSSMPRTVGFAFAAVANHLPANMPRARNQVHLYYVPAKEYLLNTMYAKMQELIQALEAAPAIGADSQLGQAIKDAKEVIQDAYEYGQTKGVRPSSDGKPWVDIPIDAPGAIRPFERELLILLSRENFPSVSALAEEWAREHFQSPIQWKSKVIYNIGSLEQKGLVSLAREGRRSMPQLTSSGRLLAHTMTPAP
jgi:hypothetical protein